MHNVMFSRSSPDGGTSWMKPEWHWRQSLLYMIDLFHLFECTVCDRLQPWQTGSLDRAQSSLPWLWPITAHSIQMKQVNHR